VRQLPHPERIQALGVPFKRQSAEQLLIHNEKNEVTVLTEGLERSRRARWTHGVYSKKAKAILRESRRRWRELLALLS
jgi:hypothetical protein